MRNPKVPILVLSQIECCYLFLKKTKNIFFLSGVIGSFIYFILHGLLKAQFLSVLTLTRCWAATLFQNTSVENG